MSCLSIGILQARLDGELSEAELKAVETHLASCAVCHGRAEALATQADEVRRALATLAPLPDNTSGDARLALAGFRAELDAQCPASYSWLGRLLQKRWRPAWAWLALLVIIAGSLSFAPVRGWGQRILAMLRVQKIAVIAVDPQYLPGPQGAGVPGRMIGQLLSDSVVVTMSPGEPRPAVDSAEASQMAGYRVRLPGALPDVPRIKVYGEQGFQMTLNRDRLQGVLDEVGRSDLEIPASIDGALVAVHIPKLVSALYGQCPDRPVRDAHNPPQTVDLTSCVALAQVRSPIVSVPPELNIQQLAEVGLQAAGMSPQDAQAFCQTVDWTSTLVLPIPRNAGSYETVSVDGVQGTLIVLPGYGRRPSGYELLWVKTGMIYSLTGFGSPDQAVPLADSLE